jgi:hypothetical protein
LIQIKTSSFPAANVNPLSRPILRKEIAMARCDGLRQHADRLANWSAWSQFDVTPDCVDIIFWRASD